MLRYRLTQQAASNQVLGVTTNQNTKMQVSNIKLLNDQPTSSISAG
jgi:hypothetical protein